MTFYLFQARLFELSAKVYMYVLKHSNNTQICVKIVELVIVYLPRR